MSLLNDITTVVGGRSPYGANGQQPTLGASGSQPGGPNAAQQVSSRFSSVFGTTFTGTLAEVVERGRAGEFEDQSLKLEEQAALNRLRIAQQQAGTTPIGTGGVPGAPQGSEDGIGGDGPAVTGGGGSTGSAGGASAAPDAGFTAVAEQRELLAVRVRQGESRLRNVSASLARDFPLAAKLVSASTGTWDPETFVPRTRDEAEAFAQRLVIDVTEAAARLDVVKSELDAVAFEVAQGAGPEAQQRLAQLQAAFERQQAYVDKLAKVVDRHSGGQMTDAGVDARAGRTMRTASDLPVEEIVATLRARGASEEEITRVVGAMEASVEQEKQPGGSQRLKSMASDMTRTLLADFNRRMDRMREDGRRAAEERAEERRLEDKRADRKRSEQRRVEQRSEQQRAQREAEFQQWLRTLEAQSAQRRQAS